MRRRIPAGGNPPSSRTSLLLSVGMSLSTGSISGARGAAGWPLMWLATWTGTIFITGTAALLVPLAFAVVDAFLIPGWVRRRNARTSAALARASALTPPPAGAGASGAAVAPHDAPKDLRTRLLRAAHRGDGRLTLTQAVMETEADFGEVETALHALVTAGHIDVDNDPDSGVVLYLFPELVGRPGKAGP